MLARIFRKLTTSCQHNSSRSLKNMTCKDDKLRLCDFDAFGFDIDHTIAKFKLVELFKLSYKSVAAYLVEKKGYSSELLKDIYIDKHLLNKGLFVDGQHGNILKLSKDGRIIRGSHGTKPMSKEELQAVYGQDLHWKHSAEFRKTVTNTLVHTRFVETFFDVPFMMLFARLVDITDKKGQKYDFYSDVYESIVTNYKPHSYSEGSSRFFEEMKNNESKYLVKCSKAIENWFTKLKKMNKLLFIVSNSYIDFASATMRTVLGDEWLSYFDLCVAYSKKPTFFSGNESFLRLDGPEEKDQIKELTRGMCVSQGNVKDLEMFLKTATGKENPKVVFFGDSIRSDCFPAKTFANWSTVLILEEMDAEGYERTDGSMNVNSNTDTPAPKKSKIEDRMTIDEEEIDHVLSDVWGSFLYDPLFTDVSESSEEKTMNTFWGSIISECCDITVPNLDYIAGIPLDFEFTRFKKNNDCTGFHPGRPSSLL